MVVVQYVLWAFVINVKMVSRLLMPAAATLVSSIRHMYLKGPSRCLFLIYVYSTVGLCLLGRSINPVGAALAFWLMVYTHHILFSSTLKVSWSQFSLFERKQCLIVRGIAYRRDILIIFSILSATCQRDESIFDSSNAECADTCISDEQCGANGECMLRTCGGCTCDFNVSN